MSSQSPGIGSALPEMNANTSAYVLTNDGVTPSWEAVASLGLPPQTGHSGEFLTTNGTAASWGVPTADGILPTQTSKSGYFLTTNGTTVSWGISLTALLPAQSTHSGEFLTTDGAGVLSWAAVTGAGVDTMAAVGSAPSDDGASIAGTTLTLQPADLTHPGVVTVGAQTWDGVKTFNAVPVAAGVSAPTTSTFTLAGNRTDGGTNIGVVIDNLVALTTAGAKIASFQNHEVEKAYIDKDGLMGFTHSTVPSSTLVSVGNYSNNTFGIWTYPDTTPSSTNFRFASDVAGSALIQAYLAGIISFRINNVVIGTLNPTNLDLTGLGNGGSIKLKSADGTTYTATIANGGTWNIA